MIDIQIDTRVLEAKLAAAKRTITKSIGTGASKGVEAVETEIDTFMFVPLAFEEETQQQGTETTVTLNARLNIPRERRFVRRNNKKYGGAERYERYQKPAKKQKSKRWHDWVKQLGGEGKTTIASSVSSEIRRRLK
jgi:hypothetical protein